MSDKTTKKRDSYTFSLGGMSAKSSFILTPAIAHDRIARAMDEKFRQRQDQDDQPDTARELGSWGRFWLRARRRAA